MRYFENHKRRVMKKQYTKGSRTVLESNEMLPSFEINESSGVPLSLEIKGRTEQGENKASYYLDYLKNTDNYTLAGASGAYVISLPSAWVGKMAKYSIFVNKQIEGLSIYLSDGTSFLFSSTAPLLDGTGAYEVSGDSFTHLIFTGVNGQSIEETDGTIKFVLSEIISFWQNNELFVDADLSVYFPSPLLSSNDDQLEIELVCNGEKTTILLPKYIIINGTEIPLLMSEYDSLLVDGVNKKVTYKRGSWTKNVTGNEVWAYNNYANTTFSQRCYQRSIAYPVILESDIGYCTHFKNLKWSAEMIKKGDYTCSVVEGYTWVFRLTGGEDLSVFTELAKEKHLEGEPISLLGKRKDILEYDLTGTELGDKLLSLIVPEGKSGVLNIKSKIGVGKAELIYYSMLDIDTYKIGISYISENGKEIASRKEYNVRRGSIYKVVPPHISGYTIQSKEESGIATSDKEIILTYKEE